MHKQWIQHFRQGLLVFGAVALVTVSVAGPIHAAAMPMGEHGQMVGCPLMMDQAALCPMNLNAHLALWRSMFIAVLPMVLGGAAVMLWLWLDGRRFSRHREGILFRIKKRSVLKHRGYAVEELTAQALQIFRRALAAGVLHPKIYPVFAR